MTDREKLIELIKSAVHKETYYTSDGKPVTYINRHIVDFGEVKILADYLLANGVIVPSCKEGDIIYFIDDIFENLEHGKVCGFLIYEGKMSLVVDNGEENFIASWYLTREEAEQALKEREKK